jgi:hypothetical protein
VEYRGIRYTIRARIERGQWHVAIYPDGNETDARIVYGARSVAESQAHFLIDQWRAAYYRSMNRDKQSR